MTKKRRFDPNRYQTADVKKSLFSFNLVRRNVLIGGLLTGTVGGFLMIQQYVMWQILGVFVIAFAANYQVSKAARNIPLWQAIVLYFTGLVAALFGVIMVGAAYYRPMAGG